MTDRPRGAILQRDKKTYAIVPRTPLGLVTPEILENIAAVARRHHVPVLKLTSAQRIALVGLEPSQVEPIWQELGMDVGPAVGVCVHYVQACPGDDWCKYGKGDSLGLAARIEERFVGQDTPAKVKIGVSGCPMNCAESFVRDVGLFARKTGWTLVVGGNAGTKPRIGDVVARDLDEDHVVDLAERCLALYASMAKRKERTSRFVNRVGIDAIRSALGVD